MTRPALVLAIAVAVAVLAGSGLEARADDRAIASARELLGELRYDEARTALEDALARGDAGRDELAILYRLLGEIAAATGDDATAREHFATTLALDPEASLAPTVSPKISQPFEAARTELAAREPLAAHSDVDATAVTVVVDGDPTGLVAGARARFLRDGVRDELVEGGAERFTLDLPAGATDIEIELVDEHGNAVVSVGSIDAISPATVDVGPRDDPGRDAPPVLLRWQLWGGVAVGFAAVGGVAGLTAGSKADEAESLADGTDYSDARLLEEAAQRRARYANLAFAAAGACAVTAAVLYWRSRDDSSRPSERRTSLVPSLSPGGVGVAAELRF